MSAPQIAVKRGRVYLVGAGPGDPGLITAKGRDLLDVADAIVYDALANPRLLDRNPTAERHYVGKKASSHFATQDQINQLLIDLARQGKCVVRLKGGDPFVFGRGGEECEALLEAGVEYEVVPGITAGIAAFAYSGIPVTHRDLNSGFTIVTGHEKEQAYQDGDARARAASDDAAKASDLDWAALAKMPCVVFYMGVKALPRIVEKLSSHGLSLDTPAATVQWGTLPKQKTVLATVGTIVERNQAAGIGSPAVTIVGAVASLREKLAWFERRPLHGKTIIVTRTRQQSSELAIGLEAMGADVLIAPTIEIEQSQHLQAIHDALGRAHEFDWVLLTSANAPSSLRRFLHSQTQLDIRTLARSKVGVVGAKTAEGCRLELSISPDLIADEASAEGLAEALIERHEVKHKRFLLLRADIARVTLVERLTHAGAAEVLDIPIYHTRSAQQLPGEVIDALQRRAVDWITFASSSSVRNFVSLLGEHAAELLRSTRIASIGPKTSETVRELGLAVAVEAPEASIESLQNALISA